MTRLRQYIMPAVQLLAVTLLFLLTLMPVEVRWAEADGWLMNLLPVIGAAAIALLIICRTEGRLMVTDILVFLWSIYYLCRIYIGTEYPGATECLQTLCMMALYVMLRLVLHDTRLPALALVLILIACALYETALGASQLVNGTSRHHLFLLTGSFQNPGPYSAYLMMGAVCGLAALKENEYPRDIWRIRGRYLVLIPTLLMLALLPSTWSRSAFAGLGICVLIIFRKHYWKYRWLVWGVIALMAIALYFLKRGSADGRSLIWTASLATWMHSPWLGVGIGGFRNACAEGIAGLYRVAPASHLFDSAGVTDYAYNSLVKILVEQGIVGALFSVLLSAIAMVRLYRVSRPLFMAMLSLLIFSMTSYPFELLPYRIIVVTMLAWRESATKSRTNLPVSRIMSIFVGMMAVAIGCMLRARVRENMERDREADLFSGMRNAAFLIDYYELLPYEMDNSQYLFDFASVLRDEGRYMDSNAILRMGAEVSADPMFHVIMGNNYRDDGFIRLAEEEYRKAYAVMPNRLYPLYQQMMMYAESGRSGRARDMAHRIQSANVKIKSKATEQMRQKADSVLQAQEDRK